MALRGFQDAEFEVRARFEAFGCAVVRLHPFGLRLRALAAAAAPPRAPAPGPLAAWRQEFVALFVAFGLLRRAAHVMWRLVDIGDIGESFVGGLWRIGLDAGGFAPAAAAAPPPPAAPPASIFVIAARAVFACLGTVFGVLAIRFDNVRFIDLGSLDDRRRLHRRRVRHTDRRLATFHRVIGSAGQRIVGGNGDGDAKAALEIAQVRALLVEDIKRDLSARAHRNVMRRALDQRIFEQPQYMQGDRTGRAHRADAGTMRAEDLRAFEHAGADALARHFEQTEMRDAADLDAGAV